MRKKRLFISLLAVVATVMIAVPLTYALSPAKQVPGEIQVIHNVQDVEVYLGPEYAQPIEGFTLVIPRGNVETLNFRVENTGIETVDVSVRMVPETVDWGTMNLTPTALGTLEPGETADWSLAIDIPETTEAGTYLVVMELY